VYDAERLPVRRVEKSYVAPVRRNFGNSLEAQVGGGLLDRVLSLAGMSTTLASRFNAIAD
jgi:hypothetical protein